MQDMCSLVVQWLGLGVFAARGPISISEQGIKILQTSQCSQKKKKKKRNIPTVKNGKEKTVYLKFLLN